MKERVRNWCLVVATALAAGLLIGPGQAWGQETSPAADAVPNTPTNYGSYECLYNDQTQCLDVVDNHFAQGQAIWMYSSSTGNGLGWKALSEGHVRSDWPFSDRTLDSRYSGDIIYIFHKTGAFGLLSPYCLGESSGFAELDNACSGTTGTWWVKDGNELVNVLRSDYLGQAEFLIATSNANESPVEVGTTSGNWYQWKVKT